MEIIAISTISTILIASIVIYSHISIKKITNHLKQHEQDMNRRMYELAILKELDERAGYSLNVQQIADIIVGSLHQLIGYSVASYMLLEPEKVIFKVHLEQSVTRKFIDEIKSRMLRSLNALLGEGENNNPIEEIVSGAILLESGEMGVGSFFNIPLVIGGKAAGILTVAHTEVGHYKDEEMTILYKITQQASQAVSKLQEVVKTEQRKLSAMVESMGEGVVMTDKDYRVMVANPAVRQALGLVQKEELHIFDFIEALNGKYDFRGKLEESTKLNKILIEPNVVIGERVFQIIVSPVKNIISINTEEILGGVVIFHDITHEKEIEKMRDDFTSMMVHELRSPLDNIKKMSEYLRSKTALKNKKAFNEYLPLIYANSSQMLSLVNDLLDIAKMESGKFEIRKEPADLKSIIDSRLLFYEIQAKDGKLKLSAKYDKNLPQAAEFDPSAVTQALNNYISNALKFTQQNGSVIVQALVHHGEASLVKEAKEADIFWILDDKNNNLSALSDSLIIAVTDTGAGISEDHIPELFNKFKQFKAKAESIEKKGTGLGLAIVKGIVEAHNGTVGVVSKEGVGSTFYFTLPL